MDPSRLPDMTFGSEDATIRSYLTERIGPFWSACRVVEALRLGGTWSLMREVAGGRILGLEASGGAFLAPASQFQCVDGRAEVKPHVRIIIEQLKDQEPWRVALLLTTPCEQELGGATPLETDASHDSVRDFARQIEREWLANWNREDLTVVHVLCGQTPYDHISPRAQARVRVAWQREPRRPPFP